LNTTKGVISDPMRDALRYAASRWSVLLGCLFMALTLLGCASATQTPARSAQPSSGSAKNVILMISDGCGYNHIQATDYYRGSAAVYETFPVQLGMTTYPFGSSEQPGGYDPARMWQDFDYSTGSLTTDSAAAATALASGVKTLNGAIAVDPDGTPVETVTERAESLGKATGIVTTVPWSHATPAVFASHAQSRDDYAAIARQMIQDSTVDVIMGAGNPDFDNNGDPAVNDALYVGGDALWGALTDSDPATPAVADADGDGSPDPWTLLQTKADFAQLATAKVTPTRVCGTAQVYGTLQQSREGSALADPFTVPLNTTVPDLATMVKGALNVLDEDPDGFFLMVEGGAVDWASYFGETGRMIEEQSAFDEAVDAVVKWVLDHGGWEQNLLVVTADHETGMLWGTGSGGLSGATAFVPVADRGKGVVPGVSWNTIGHTNQLVPLYAIGVGSRLLLQRATLSDPVRGKYIDNTDIARLLFGSL
jgi:alkaline phosphatase